MLVYRISKTKYANDLSGEGSRLNGGRWNHISIPCVYTSESIALAVLEFTVNVDINFLPDSLSIVTVQIPDKDVMEFDIKDLPDNWREIPSPIETKDFGTAFLKSLSSPVIKIPSVVIPDEHNYILNPLHKESKNFKVISVKNFEYDKRIRFSK
ncbi:MAG: RES family NAD+ phosphorylase [Ignavibacteria bacterium]